MVTSGTCRQSSRPLSDASLAAPASERTDAGEAVRDLEVVDCDQTDRTLGFRIADDLDDLGFGDHQAAAELGRDLDEIAVAGVAEIAAVDPHLLELAIDRDQAGAVVIEANDADLAAARLVEDFFIGRAV